MFESRLEHGYLSLVSVVFLCQVGVCPRADHYSRGILPSVMSECDRETSIMKMPWLTRGSCAMKKTTNFSEK